MAKFAMAVPKIVEGKLLPLEAKPSGWQLATEPLALHAELIADEVKMAARRIARKVKAELSNALILARFIAPAVRVAAVVIASDMLTGLAQGVAL